MKLSKLKSTAGDTLASVIISIAITAAAVPLAVDTYQSAVDTASQAGVTQSAARLNNALAYYCASGGRVPLGLDTVATIELLQSKEEIPGFMTTGPWIHQQSEPKLKTSGWRVVRHAEGDFRPTDREGEIGFVGFY